MILGNFPKNSGKITPLTTGAGATYFAGFSQIDDPSRANVTTLQTLQNSFSNKAITDASGNIILANPGPGQVGNLGRQWIEGPSHIGLDANLVKRIRVLEGKEFEIRVDAVNVLNTPYWNDPTVDINNVNFGRMTAGDITGANNADTRTGNRRFTFNMRLTF
jgi:hypothetical protein